MAPKKKKNDARRQAGPPKEYKVKRLMRRRIIKKKPRRAGKGATKRIRIEVVQYLVRWDGEEWNDERWDSWVNAEDITPACIAAFNGEETTGGGAAKMLAKVPTAEHPSHPGYAQAKSLYAWTKGIRSQHDGKAGQSKPSRRSSSSTSVAKASAASAAHKPATNTGTHATIQLLTNAEISLEIELVVEDIVSKVIERQMQPPPEAKRKHRASRFNQAWVSQMNVHVADLNAVIALANKTNQITRLCRLHTSLPKPFRIAFPLSNTVALARVPLHPSDIDVITVKENSWVCNICSQLKNASHTFTSARIDLIIKHFCSKIHFRVLSSILAAALENSACNQAKAHAVLEELSTIVRRNVCTAIVQRSAPFTHGTLTLELIQMTLNTLSDEIDAGEIYRARKAGFRAIADLGTRFNALRIKCRVNQEDAKQPCLLDRTNVSRTVGRIGDEAIAQKKVLVSKAKLSSIFLDESTTQNMKSRPVFCGAMTIDEYFNWMMFFVGQTDTAGSETGQTYFNKVKEVYEPFGIVDMMKESGAAVGTDGCAAMRSTPEHAGPDARNDEGESFVAKFNTHIAPRRSIALHSALHILSLATGDAVTKVLPSWWLRHVRLMYTYFARSASRKSLYATIYEEAMDDLRALVDVLEGLDEAHTWRLTYPKIYCASRWMGLEQSTDSIVAAYIPLFRMKRRLIELGYGAPRQADETDDPEISDNEDDSFDFDEFLDLDGTETGRDDAAASKRDKLLDRKLGVTHMNWGLDSMISAFLKPISLCTVRLQTVRQPISHRVARELMRVRRSICFFMSDLDEDEDFPIPYDAWRDAMTDGHAKRELVDSLDSVLKRLAQNFIASFDRRFAPYMEIYNAMELIDPTAPDTDVTSETWQAVKLICKRFDLDYKQTKKEIIAMRRDAVELSRLDSQLCKVNLLKYYHEEVRCCCALISMTHFLSLPCLRGTQVVTAAARCMHLERYAAVVFILPWETVLIESLFSTMNYNKSKTRSSLADASVANIIHTKDLELIVADTTKAFSPEVVLNTKRALEHKLSW